ncbi:MAG TPA: SIMPL domain-containing protein [Candidatus Limnocylindrales bacterium]|jgi:hypothetical protein
MTSERGVSVTGTGRINVSPDEADVRLGVSVVKATVGDARQVAAEVSERILAAVTARGVAGPDIQTASLEVQPEMEYPDGRPVVRGQHVSHQYAIRVRDLAQLGPVIDDAIGAGATTVDSVTFRSSRREEAESEARSLAMAAARAKAEQLASKAGVRLGRVLSIAEGAVAGPPHPMPMFRMATMAEAAPTPIESGSLEVNASVSVTWELVDQPEAAPAIAG